MNAWERLSAADEDATWDLFESKFRFRPSVKDFPGIDEPEDSVTFDIYGAFGDATRFREWTMDLSGKLVAAFRQCVPEDGVIHVLDWQHTCYRFWPHVPFEYSSQEDWPIPAFPDGDYHIFLDVRMRFGVFGHPWEPTICVFGEPLIRAFEADPPILFREVKRRGGLAV